MVASLKVSRQVNPEHSIVYEVNERSVSGEDRTAPIQNSAAHPTGQHGVLRRRIVDRAAVPFVEILSRVSFLLLPE